MGLCFSVWRDDKRNVRVFLHQMSRLWLCKFLLTEDIDGFCWKIKRKSDFHISRVGKFSFKIHLQDDPLLYSRQMFGYISAAARIYLNEHTHSYDLLKLNMTHKQWNFIQVKFPFKRIKMFSPSPKWQCVCVSCMMWFDVI